MEILEKQDPEKKRLMDEARKHKEAISGDIHSVSESTEKMITNAVVIGGALALTYLLVRQLSGGKSLPCRQAGKKKKSKTVKLIAQSAQQEDASPEQETEDVGESLLSQIGTKIANQATLMLLNLAKEKLSEYLQSRKESHEDH